MVYPKFQFQGPPGPDDTSNSEMPGTPRSAVFGLNLSCQIASLNVHAHVHRARRSPRTYNRLQVHTTLQDPGLLKRLLVAPCRLAPHCMHCDRILQSTFGKSDEKIPMGLCPVLRKLLPYSIARTGTICKLDELLKVHNALRIKLSEKSE